MTHVCVSKLTIIGSDNGLLPGWRQAIIWTNAGILLSGPLRTYFSEIWIEILIFLWKKVTFENVVYKMFISSRPQCVNSLIHLIVFIHSQHKCNKEWWSWYHLLSSGSWYWCYENSEGFMISLITIWYAQWHNEFPELHYFYCDLISCLVTWEFVGKKAGIVCVSLCVCLSWVVVWCGGGVGGGYLYLLHVTCWGHNDLPHTSEPSWNYEPCYLCNFHETFIQTWWGHSAVTLKQQDHIFSKIDFNFWCCSQSK